jgi:prolyl 4-hydroxylase
MPGLQRFPSPALELYILRDFLQAETCARLMELIDAKCRPSTIADDNGDTAFRTSDTGDLDSQNHIVAEVEAHIAALLDVEPVFGEPLQGQRYAVGQEFKPHTDYFEPDGADYDRYCARSGNRTWTAMIYLNAPGAGGATRFTRVGKTVQPETGKIIFWNNRRADRSLNPDSIHHGMKVRAGSKYVVTKWYREHPWVG